MHLILIKLKILECMVDFFCLCTLLSHWWISSLLTITVWIDRCYSDYIQLTVRFCLFMGFDNNINAEGHGPDPFTVSNCCKTSSYYDFVLYLQVVEHQQLWIRQDAEHFTPDIRLCLATTGQPVDGASLHLCDSITIYLIRDKPIFIFNSWLPLFFI